MASSDSSLTMPVASFATERSMQLSIHQLLQLHAASQSQPPLVETQGT